MKNNQNEYVKLGDVARKINDLYPDREKWTFTHYITGRDFDSGGVRLKKANQIKGNENLIGYQFQWRFQPGDVLYVVKNPRLRKAAIVDFEGICSISTFVIRTDETKMLQNLLPFLLQTEDFVSFARKNEHGSTNPFLNWKDIEEYQFSLPSLDQQKKISELLWSIEEHFEKAENLLNALINYRTSKTEEVLTKGINQKKFKSVQWLYGKKIEIPEEWDFVKFGKKVKLEYGKGLTEKERDNKKFPVYGSGGITGHHSQSSIDGPGLIVARKGSVGNVFYEKDKFFPIDTVYYVTEKETSLELKFLYYLIRHLRLENFAITSAQPGINREDVYSIPIGIPTKNEQQKIIDFLSNLDTQIENLQNHFLKLKDLRRSIMNKKLILKKGDVIVQ